MNMRTIPALLIATVLLASCGAPAPEEHKIGGDHDRSTNEAVHDHDADTAHTDHDGHTHDGHKH